MAELAMTKKTLKSKLLAADLLQFYDEFAEFHDYCAFFCDALACLVTEEESIDTDTAIGASSFAYSMKRKAHQLKLQLKEIRRKAKID